MPLLAPVMTIAARFISPQAMRSLKRIKHGAGARVVLFFQHRHFQEDIPKLNSLPCVSPTPEY
jgi:hypothetical protein